jgi:tetratricopeptide (TPR) repeat protein
MMRFFSIIAHAAMIVLVLTALATAGTAGSGVDLAEKHKARGNIFYSQRKFTQAIEAFTSAIAEDPDYLAAYYNRGLAYYDLQLYYKAIVDFDMVLMMSPDDRDAYLARGLCYGKVNKLQLALQDLNKAAELGNRQAGRIIESGELTRQLELARSKQRKISAIINETRSETNRTSEIIGVGNEFGGNTIMTTYAKGDPLYEGTEGLFKQMDYYDPSDRLRKTELFHTASFIADHDRNMTRIIYDDKGRTLRKEFTYTGRMLNHTGVQYYNEQGALVREVILDKHGKEISSKTVP